MCRCVLLSLPSVLMASSTMQSGLKPWVLDSSPSRDAIFSLTELSVSCRATHLITTPAFICSDAAAQQHHCTAETVTAERTVPCSSAPAGSGPPPPRSPSPPVCGRTAAGTAGRLWSWWPYRGRCAALQTYWVWRDEASWPELLHGESENTKHLRSSEKFICPWGGEYKAHQVHHLFIK